MPKLIKTSNEKAGNQRLGFWCSCPAFKFSNPDPQSIYKAMLSAVSVTAIITKKGGENTHFEAWTTNEHKYSVVHGPTDAPGFCKHCARCACLLVGNWLYRGLGQMVLERGAAERNQKDLEKEIKNLRRKSGRRKSNGNAGPAPRIG